MKGFYKPKGALKELLNKRGIGYDHIDYVKKGIAFVIEDGQIEWVGKENNDKRRKGT